MSMISCDMRYGRSDEQKRALSAGLLRVVSEATGETADNVFFVIREGRGINFVEHGGFSAFMVLAHTNAIFSPPGVGGVLLDAPPGDFRIDHD